PGKRCSTGADCTAGVCNGGICGCDSGADCPTGFTICVAGICTPDSCADSQTNGTETDLNCGGLWKACVVGKHCGTGNDCLTELCLSGGTCGCTGPEFCTVAFPRCSAGHCMRPLTCPDNAQDSTETDVDCGGPSCNPCGAGKHCST